MPGKEGEKTIIREMPTKETLEKFMDGFRGEPPTVLFNREKGVFEDLDKPAPKKESND